MRLLTLLAARALTTSHHVPPTLLRGRELWWAQQAPLRRVGVNFARCCATDAASDARDRLERALRRAAERTQKKRGALENEAAEAAKGEALGKWAQLVVSNLYRIDERATTATVEDWDDGGKEVTLTFDLKTYSSPLEQAEAAFKKARRQKRGVEVIESLQLEALEAEEEIKRLLEQTAGYADEPYAIEKLRDDLLADAKRAKRLNLKPAELAPAAAPAAAAAAPPKAKGGWSGRRFETPSGVPILVGRNKKENEKLSLDIAKDPDVWLHARGAPGAHVIIQYSQAKKAAREDEEAREVDLQMAADLAAFYSDLRNERKAEVMFCNPKHISKPRKAPVGAVRVSKEGGTVLGRPEDVPDDCKEARAERGVQNDGGWG